MAESNQAIEDPAEADPSLSAQMGGEALCGGPVMFPMADGADADRWAREFGYPLESQTGNISIGGLMNELQAHDEAGRFMLEVYDEIVRLKGGEGSEGAAAFLSNFMPPMPNSGDQRRHYFKLIFADEVRLPPGSTSTWNPTNSSAYRDGQLITMSDPATDLLGSELKILVAPYQTSTTFSILTGVSTQEMSISASRAAQEIISEVESSNRMKPWIDWLIFGANVLTVFAGVGVTVGAVRIAATAGARLMASTALVFEVADGTEYISGFLGGKGAGYNPLKEAFRAVGSSSGGGSGAQTAEHIYNTLNIAIGFGGKVGLTAGSLYGAAMMPARCQPIEGGIIEEQVLPSQGPAQRTVF